MLTLCIDTPMTLRPILIEKYIVATVKEAIAPVSLGL